MPNVNRFEHFLGIDWSGAKGERHKGIALALADRNGAPVLLERAKGWSREDVLSFLQNDLPDDTLVGLDLGIGFPFADCGAYFPTSPSSPNIAKKLWALVDEVCRGAPHLSVQPFVDHPTFAPYFRNGSETGPHFRCDGAEHGRGRFRVTEHAQAAMGAKPYSNFNLVGAAQVGKSSLTGMRMLHRLDGRLPVWPVDPLPVAGSAVVEIYTSLAAIAAGRRAGAAKVRDYDVLNEALAVLGSDPVEGHGAIDDHSADALLTAAWLRQAADDPRLWRPTTLTPSIAQTEGWTFGAL